MDTGAIISGVGLVVLGVMGWLIQRSVSHIDTRSERMERKHDALAEKIDKKFDVVHARITTVAESHAKLEGTVMAAIRPDSKSGIPKFK